MPVEISGSARGGGEDSGAERHSGEADVVAMASRLRSRNTPATSVVTEASPNTTADLAVPVRLWVACCSTW